MATSSSADAGAYPIHVRPPGRWSGVRLGEVWEHRELLYFLTKRELQIRYKQSVLGVGWAVLQPVALGFIFALFFGRLAGVPSNGLPFPVFAIAGLTPWLYVSQSVSQAANSLVADQELISKVYFPRLTIPLAKIVSFLLDLGMAVLILVAFALIYGAPISANAVFLPTFLLLAVITATGVGTYLAALNVSYRDVTVVTPLLIQIWFFVTPVVYPGTLVTGELKYLYALNPMVSVVNGVRWSMFDTPAPAAGELVASVIGAAGILLVAMLYFRRSETFFADVV
jgi:lipopolysaccharide transport system permease protein